MLYSRYYKYIHLCAIVILLFIVSWLLSSTCIDPKTYHELNIKYLRIYAGARCFKVSEYDIRLILVEFREDWHRGITLQRRRQASETQNMVKNVLNKLKECSFLLCIRTKTDWSWDFAGRWARCSDSTLWWVFLFDWTAGCCQDSHWTFSSASDESRRELIFNISTWMPK